MSMIFRALVGIEHVMIEDRDSVLRAIDALESGMDFADALHLVRSQDSAAFVTFDRRLASQAERSGLPVAIELLR